MTRLTWEHAARTTVTAYPGVPSASPHHEPWIPAPLLPHITPVLRAAALAGVAGVVGGVATSYAESVVGAPAWSHSFAPWAMITTGVGFALRGRWQVAAMAGLLTQLGLVLGFALSQSLLAGGPLATQSLVTYVVVALVAGPFFAAAAGFLRDPCVVTRTLGLVTVSAPWVVDGVRMMGSALDHDPQVAVRLAVGAGLLAVGIALPLMINGSPRDSLRNLGVAAGLGVFIVVALVLSPNDGRPDEPELHPPRISLP